DYTEALKWTRMAAGKGHSDAEYNLGIMFLNGYGVHQDDAEAFMWLMTRTFLGIIGLSHPAVSDQAKKCADGQPY
ncbi:MAG: hypothetical protein SOW06_02880, partial [Succinivibrionaceae bacterium]|nr:hypothetical protein [Succinivibrionaceae bacterium]